MTDFDLTGKVAIITGGKGFLGQQHCEAIERAGGIAIPADITSKEWWLNVCLEGSIHSLLQKAILEFDKVDILINNAANNPKEGSTLLKDFSIEQWWQDIDIGLTGAFLCSKIIGTWMANTGGGVIINIASDLGVVAPDQRIYAPGTVKPVSYSVVKHGIIGLTKYLATYWNGKVRCNALSPGGIYNNQPKEMVQKIEERIPMERMAHIDEYQGAIVFLCSNASSYMNGANLIIDGGRSVW